MHSNRKAFELNGINGRRRIELLRCDEYRVIVY